MQPRCEPRTTLHVTVRVYGLDAAGHAINQPATTFDVSLRGVRVSGVRCWERAGDIIGVRYGAQKARYRIAWVGKRGTATEAQIGLQCLESGKIIWGVTPAHVASAAVAPSSAPPTAKAAAGSGLRPATAADRRRAVRYRVNGGGAQVREQGAPAGQFATLHDLSLGGCYVESASPLALDARAEIHITVGDHQIRARGIVVKSDRLVGMAIRFTEMALADREHLAGLIASLAKTAQEA